MLPTIHTRSLPTHPSTHIIPHPLSSPSPSQSPVVTLHEYRQGHLQDGNEASLQFLLPLSSLYSPPPYPLSPLPSSFSSPPPSPPFTSHPSLPPSFPLSPLPSFNTPLPPSHLLLLLSVHSRLPLLSYAARPSLSPFILIEEGIPSCRS